jgi:hypothetical protein
MDYNNGKIYKITDIAYTKMYIGSTTQSLSKRFNAHKSSYKIWTEGKHKCSVFSIFDEFGINNCKIELIENYACNSKNELERKEGEHIKNNNCVNKIIVGRTKEEWRENNRDSILKNQKEWREANKQKVKEYYEDNKNNILQNQKKHYEDNKEKILEYQKRYRETNKEKISEKKKEYYEANKEKINEKKRTV